MLNLVEAPAIDPLLLALYRRMIQTVPPPNYVARSIIYTALRQLPDCWEGRNTRLIKETLDAIDTKVAGRDTGDDWRLK